MKSQRLEILIELQSSRHLHIRIARIARMFHPRMRVLCRPGPFFLIHVKTSLIANRRTRANPTDAHATNTVI